ncbi:MAG: SGNH/GDSL hydrolase family protein [Proteobacteria bacterium]|nr:SGNH/GDSL hydrolase family protein [Pseudomonadota bacterium]
MAAATSAAAGIDVGVSDHPCRDVPVQPTAAHQASADPYQNWMHDWLGRDWGQLCRYSGENAALPPATGARVVFFGDSLTENWKNLQPDFFGPERLDRGISGQTTGQMLVRFRADVIDLHPAIVHILAGTNDIAGNGGPTSLAIIEGNIASMAEQARAHGARVIIASILPAARYGWRPQVEPVASIAAMNAWLRDYAAREHLTYVDYYAALEDGHGGFKAALADDGVHPNAAGYAVMRPLAEAALRQAQRQGAR